MIPIPRSLCRDVLAVIRKLGRGRTAAGLSVELIAGRAGLTIQAATAEVAVRHHTPGRRPDGRLVVPLEVLADAATRGDDPVMLGSDRHPPGSKKWARDGPVIRKSPIPMRAGAFPTPPARITPCPPGLLAALDAAGTVTAKNEASRYVLTRIQLRGGRGAIVASDSKQLLVQTGFPFPWSGEVLVPRSEVFAELAAAKPASVSMARTATHVWIAAGPWSVALAIDAAGKFPNVDTLLARIKKPTGELILDPAGQAMLIRELPKLPGRDEEHRPVTLDLAGPVVRAKGEGDTSAITVPLLKARVQGKPVRVACDRTYLLTALKLGLNRMAATTDDQPLVWRDATRTYLFLPLGAEAIVAPTRLTGSRRVAWARDSSTVVDRPTGSWTKRRPKVPTTPPRKQPPPNAVPPATPRRNGKPKAKTSIARPTRRVLGGLWDYVGGLFGGRRPKPAIRRPR